MLSVPTRGTNGDVLRWKGSGPGELLERDPSKRRFPEKVAKLPKIFRCDVADREILQPTFTPALQMEGSRIPFVRQREIPRQISRLENEHRDLVFADSE